METFVVQRSQSSLPSMVYTTLDDCTLDQLENGSHVYDVHVQRFQYSNEQTDKHPETSMSLLEAKPKPYGDFFAEKCIFEPFYRNTDACCCFCCCFLCHC